MKAARAFTLVEVLIVVIILAIIAAVVLPQFSNASAKARASMLADNLRCLRMQITVFKGQHYGVSPGYVNTSPPSSPTAERFVEHMTMSSNTQGQTAAVGTEGYPFGPYFKKMPENPVNGLTTVRIVADGDSFPGAPAGTDGWVYQASTLTFKADVAGTDEVGKAYYDY